VSRERQQRRSMTFHVAQSAPLLSPRYWGRQID
jgi:hypothetical protein